MGKGDCAEAVEVAESVSIRVKGRKHLRYGSLWARKRKIHQDSGKAYETYRGETKAAKKLEHISSACS